MRALKFVIELIYDVATIHSHPTGHPNFQNEENKRNWKESQKPIPITGDNRPHDGFGS